MANGNKKKTKDTDEALDQDTVIDSSADSENPGDESSEEVGESSEMTGDELNALEDADPQESQPVPEAATPSVPLHTRIEKTVHGLRASGNPAGAQALNKVEILMGSLKLSLPSAIDGVGDEDLKADLQSLLAIL